MEESFKADKKIRVSAHCWTVEIMGKKLHMAPLYGMSCMEKDNLL